MSGRLCFVFSVSTHVLDASLWLCCAYLTGGLIADKEGEDEQDESDQDEKDDDDGEKDIVDSKGEPGTDGSSSDNGGGEGAGHADKDSGGEVYPAACKGAGIPETHSPGPGSTVEESTRTAD